MPYKNPVKVREHARLRMRKFRLSEEIQERERTERKRRHRENPGHDAEYQKNHAILHPKQEKAHQALNYAVRIGKIKRGPCVECGAVTNIHGHHKDYNYPLKVEWLCTRCHMRVEKSIALTIDFPMSHKYPELLYGRRIHADATIPH